MRAFENPNKDSPLLCYVDAIVSEHPDPKENDEWEKNVENLSKGVLMSGSLRPREVRGWRSGGDGFKEGWERDTNRRVNASLLIGAGRKGEEAKVPSPSSMQTLLSSSQKQGGSQVQAQSPWKKFNHQPGSHTSSVQLGDDRLNFF